MNIDLIIISIFFAVIFIIGLFERKKINIEDYWVNNRKTNKFIEKHEQSITNEFGR